MESNDEPITIYALLVGESGNWTLQDVSVAVKRFADTDLLYGMGIVSRLGPSFQLAFGADDHRTLRVVALAMPAIGTEIQRRGGDPLRIDLDLAWRHWCEMLQESTDESETIPTHRLVELRHVILEALSLLGTGTDAAMAKEALNEAASAIGSLLTHRGFSGDVHSGDAPQA